MYGCGMTKISCSTNNMQHIPLALTPESWRRFQIVQDYKFSGFNNEMSRIKNSGPDTVSSSFWIDFLLLPEKLDEHLKNLEAARVVHPNAPELIAAFLDQAASYQKLPPGSSSESKVSDEVDISVPSGNQPTNGSQPPSLPPSPTTPSHLSPSKEGGIANGLFPNNFTYRTASLLCERAVRVAITSRLSLADMETQISSPAHQQTLLRALAAFDPDHSLVHTCNLHRWCVRVALDSHPIGSAAPNSGFVPPKEWEGLEVRAGDRGDKKEVRSSDSQAGGTEEEDVEASEKFLEGVLKGVGGDVGPALRCLIMYDLAELRFMRRQVSDAALLFAKVATMLGLADMANKGAGPGVSGGGSEMHGGGGVRLDSVPRERLDGFLMASRMLIAGGGEGGGGLLREHSVAKKRRRGQEETGVSTECLPAEAGEGDGDRKSEGKVELAGGIDELMRLPGGVKGEVEGGGVVMSEDDVIETVERDVVEGFLEEGFLDALERAPGVRDGWRMKLGALTALKAAAGGHPPRKFLECKGQLEKSPKTVEYLFRVTDRLLGQLQRSIKEEKGEVEGRKGGRDEHVSALVVHRRLREFRDFACAAMDREWLFSKSGPESLPPVRQSLGGEEGLLWQMAREDRPEEVENLARGSVCMPGGKLEGADLASVLKRRAQILIDEAVQALVSATWQEGEQPGDPITGQLQAARRICDVALEVESTDADVAGADLSTAADVALLKWMAEVMNGGSWKCEGVLREKVPGKSCLEFVMIALVDLEAAASLASLCDWAKQRLRGKGEGEGEAGAGGREGAGMSVGVGREDVGGEGEVDLARVFGSAFKEGRLTPGSFLEALELSAAEQDTCTAVTGTAGIGFQEPTPGVRGESGGTAGGEDGGRGGWNRGGKGGEKGSSHEVVPGGKKKKGNKGKRGRAEGGGAGSVDVAGRNLKVDSRGGGVGGGVVKLARLPALRNVRVLEKLLCHVAHWLDRCHREKRYRWPTPLERYGMSGEEEGVGVSPDFGRGLLRLLLERVVRIGEGGCNPDWLLGLGDLAFEDGEWLKALRWYMQAGGLVSGGYCCRGQAMSESVFSPWVVERMVASLSSMGSILPAVVLCQALPSPDFDTAFQLLQKAPLMGEREAETYLECIWEIPILELLVHLHSKGGDERRVLGLIRLIQQPALNVHNPPAIRSAHIETVKQKFMLRLAGELKEFKIS